MKAKDLRRGMKVNGREITGKRSGVGSGKGWTYLEYADGRFELTRVPSSREIDGVEA